MTRGLLLLSLASLFGLGCATDDDAPSTEARLLRGGITLAPDSNLDLGSLDLDAQAFAQLDLDLVNRGPTPLDLRARPVLTIRGDSALAFRVLQPTGAPLPPDATAPCAVLFMPSRPGSYEAELIVDTPNSVIGPQRFRLLGLATSTAVAPVTAAHLLDASGNALSRLDFGRLPPGSPPPSAVLTLVNTGNTRLSGLTIESSSPAVFGPSQPDRTALGPDEQASFAIGYLTDRCGSSSATLTIRYQSEAGPATLLELPLSARTAADLTTVRALSDADTGSASDRDLSVALLADGRLRALVGNAAAGSFRGEALQLDHDGCATSSPRRVPPPEDAGLDRWGGAVALDSTGETALITWTDAPDAAILTLDPDDGRPGAAARLRTLRSDGGHGASAALSGDGSLALVGQRLANSGFNPHGGVWLYTRGPSGWEATDEALYRLVPREPPRAAELGASVASSHNGDIVAGSLLYMSNVIDLTAFEAAAYVWRSATDPLLGRTWGRAIPNEAPDRRTESILLRTETMAIDDRVHLGMSRSGDLIALAFKVDADLVEVHLFEAATGGDGEPTYGVSGDPSTRRIANHVAVVDVFADWGFALDPAGDRFVLTDTEGAVIIRRTGTRWGTGSTLAGTLDTGFSGAIALSPDGAAVVGLNRAGDLSIVQLPEK